MTSEPSPPRGPGPPSGGPDRRAALLARGEAKAEGRSAHGNGRSNGSAGGSTISRERAEILHLITRLTAVRLARSTRERERERERGGERRGARPTLPAPSPSVIPVARVSMASQLPREATTQHGSGVMLMLQALDLRLQRIEAQLLPKRRSSLPVPPVQERDASATFSGIIQGQMLSDMLQLVSSNTMSGLFSVRSTASRCDLHFEEGRIVHAESPELSGEAAFFAAFGCETGTYEFRESADPPGKRSIEAGTQFLILEALRRIDESNA